MNIFLSYERRLEEKKLLIYWYFGLQETKKPLKNTERIVLNEQIFVWLNQRSFSWRIKVVNESGLLFLASKGVFFC